MAKNIVINGFGRIGRLVLRSIVDKSEFNVVAINDLTDAKTLAHLLKYDSVHGVFGGDISVSENSITVNKKNIKILSIKNPDEYPWSELKVDIVLECTGIFKDRTAAAKHLAKGAKKVIVSAPLKDADGTFVRGVNCASYDNEKHHVISNASCTTNCLAPMVKVVMENFGFVKGQMTTIHSYTNDQRILDLPHKDLRRARAAAISMIPTTTGAAKAVGLVLPKVKGKLDGFSMRVPTFNVSFVDLACVTEKSVTDVEVNNAFKKASVEGSLAGLLRYTDEPLVSIDFNNDPHSCTFDSGLTKVIDGNFLKVFGWYDNEYGYSTRLSEMLGIVASKLK